MTEHIHLKVSPPCVVDPGKQVQDVGQRAKCGGLALVSKEMAGETQGIHRHRDPKPAIPAEG